MKKQQEGTSEKKGRRHSPRLLVQIAWAALTNGYVAGFTKGGIYQGKLKKVCVPGMNCYSCPGALGSCPIGSLQAAFTGNKISFYVIGFLLLVGGIFGRFICGWLCPFGLIQDLLHKIPGKKLPEKNPSFRKIDHVARYLKYVMLGLFVIVFPLFLSDSMGVSDPWFCKYVCPVGTLEGGILLSLLNAGIRKALGGLFLWKGFLALGILILAVFLYRPFCKYICPLGAVYSFFQPISFYQISLDKGKCIQCKKCELICPMEVPVLTSPNHGECIRCGKCRDICPTQCIQMGFKKGTKEKGGSV